MKYVVLKNSQSVLSIQLPDGFGSKMEIICFENQMEFDNFLDENPVGVYQISFPHHLWTKLRRSKTTSSTMDFSSVKMIFSRKSYSLILCGLRHPEAIAIFT